MRRKTTRIYTINSEEDEQPVLLAPLVSLASTIVSTAEILQWEVEAHEEEIKNRKAKRKYKVITRFNSTESKRGAISMQQLKERAGAGRAPGGPALGEPAQPRADAASL